MQYTELCIAIHSIKEYYVQRKDYFFRLITRRKSPGIPLTVPSEIIVFSTRQYFPSPCKKTRAGCCFSSSFISLITLASCLYVIDMVVPQLNGALIYCNGVLANAVNWFKDHILYTEVHVECTEMEQVIFVYFGHGCCPQHVAVAMDLLLSIHSIKEHNW